MSTNRPQFVVTGIGPRITPWTESMRARAQWFAETHGETVGRLWGYEFCWRIESRGLLLLFPPGIYDELRRDVIQWVKTDKGRMPDPRNYILH